MTKLLPAAEKEKKTKNKNSIPSPPPHLAVLTKAEKDKPEAYLQILLPLLCRPHPNNHASILKMLCSLTSVPLFP